MANKKISGCKQLIGLMAARHEKQAGFGNRLWQTFAAWNPLRLIPGGQDFARRSGSAAEIKAQNAARAAEAARKQRQADIREALGGRRAKIVNTSGQAGQLYR